MRPAAWLRALADTAVRALEVASGPGRCGRLRPVVFFALCVLAWFAYTPVHELLHAAGCALSGGTVQELQISPRYGGHLLARIFPFVRAGGDYAGRLTGFDTRGSDLRHLATTAAPYVLTPLLGFPLLALGLRRRSLAATAAGLLVAAAPVIGLLGDYYEIGSILATRAAALLPWEEGFDPRALRSDDLFRLLGEIGADPARHGAGTAAGILRSGALIAVSQALGAFLALATMAAGLPLARLSAPAAASPRGASGSSR